MLCSNFFKQKELLKIDYNGSAVSKELMQFLTTGSFGMVFYVIMIIVSTIHTGRKIFTNWALTLAVV